MPSYFIRPSLMPIVCCLVFGAPNSGQAQIIDWLLGPSDYEECVIAGLKDANGAAAEILIRSECDSKFQARRDGRGGYQKCTTVLPSAIEETGLLAEMLRGEVCVETSGPAMSESDWFTFDELTAAKQAALNEVWATRSLLASEVYAICGEDVANSGMCITSKFSFAINNPLDSQYLVYIVFNPSERSGVSCSSAGEAYSVDIEPKSYLKGFFQSKKPSVLNGNGEVRVCSDAFGLKIPE